MTDPAPLLPAAEVPPALQDHGAARASAQRVVLIVVVVYTLIAALFATGEYRVLLLSSATLVSIAFGLARANHVDAAAMLAGLGCALTPYFGLASPEPTTSPIDEFGWVLLAAVVPAVGASTRVFIAFAAAHFVIVTSLMIANPGIPGDAVARVAGLLGVLLLLSAAQIWVIRKHETVRTSQAADLRNALVAAERSQRAREAFLALVTHELRTPLHGVLGAATVLTETQIDAEQRGLLRAIETSGESLMGLIDDVLDLTRGESEFSIGSAPFAPSRRLRALVDAQGARAANSGVTVEFRADTASGRFWSGDRRRIDQIVNNVLGNALAQSAVRQVQVECVVEEDPKPTLVVTIDDDGPGIPASEVDRIFEPFAQLDGERRGAGVGLGLPLSRALARRMGGDLVAIQKAAPGARFVLRLPVEHGQVPPSTSATASPAALLQMSALVIDDNPVNIIVSRAMLAKLGCEVETATSGRAGVEAADARVFDLILVDYRMPEMNGAQTIARLRAGSTESSRAWIVCVTASDSPEVQAECRAAGADAVWRKPMDLSSLSAQVRKLRKHPPLAARTADAHPGDPPAFA